jgi:hypothetical protein
MIYVLFILSVVAPVAFGQQVQDLLWPTVYGPGAGSNQGRVAGPPAASMELKWYSAVPKPPGVVETGMIPFGFGGLVMDKYRAYTSTVSVGFAHSIQ